MRISWAAASHPGLRRPSNEDSYCARPDLGLFVVADGMGGHAAGEVASRVAVAAIEKYIAETHGRSSHDTWPWPFDPALSVAANRLRGAFWSANRDLAEQIAAEASLRGMATTASAILLDQSAAAVAHIGDSRIYLFRSGTLVRLTRDHSWVEDQVRSGVLTAAAAQQHPWRHVVTRALAGGSDAEIDLTEVNFRPGDRVLLCSDGLVVATSDEQIEQILAETSDVAHLCARLIATANAAGGSDNVTALVVQLDAA